MSLICACVVRVVSLELYRQGEVSSGRAAQLLGLGREEFIQYASKQRIPYFQVEGEELQRELDAIRRLGTACEWLERDREEAMSSALEFLVEVIGGFLLYFGVSQAASRTQ